MPACNMIKNQIFFNMSNNIVPCCVFDANSNKLTKTINDYYNSPLYNKLLDSNENDYWVDECHRCKSTEEGGGFSERQKANRIFSSKEQIESLQFAISNYCNISCLMCTPKLSTTWQNVIREDNELEDFFDDNKIVKTFDISQIKNSNLQYLKRITITGGEPLTSPVLLQLINELDSRVELSNVAIDINTNGTKVDVLYNNIWKKFKSVKINLSIDAVEKLNDFIRLGSDWNQILQNYYNLKEMNLQLSICPTISALNINSISELYNFFSNDTFTPHILTFPTYLQYNSLPPAYVKKYVFTESNLEVINKFTTDLPYNFNAKGNKRLCNYINVLRKHYKEDLKYYLPFIEEIFI